MLMTINLSLSKIVITALIFALSRIVIIQIIFFFFQNYEKFFLSFDNHDNFSVLPLDSHCRCQQYRHAAQVLLILIIIITRPKPAYGRQGLAGLWGQDTGQAGTFWGVVNIALRAFSAQLR